MDKISTFFHFFGGLALARPYSWPDPLSKTPPLPGPKALYIRPLQGHPYTRPYMWPVYPGPEYTDRGTIPRIHSYILIYYRSVSYPGTGPALMPCNALRISKIGEGGYPHVGRFGSLDRPNVALHLPENFLSMNSKVSTPEKLWGTNYQC